MAALWAAGAAVCWRCLCQWLGTSTPQTTHDAAVATGALLSERCTCILARAAAAANAIVAARYRLVLPGLLSVEGRTVGVY